MPRPPRWLTLLPATAVLVAGCSVLPGGGDDAEPAPEGRSGPAVLGQVGWTPVPGRQVESGGTLRLGTSALPANLNRLHASNEVSDVERILEPTTGSAVRVTADGDWEVDPDYARSVEVSDTDPLTVEVRLNPQAVWQDGEKITARDMVAFWRAQNGSDDEFEVVSTEGYEDIEAVEPGDDDLSYTVRFARPTADWPRFVYPLLPRSVTSSSRAFNGGFTDDAVPSNGPFMVTGVDRETGRIVQERNPRWWGAAPRLERISWQAATPEVQLEAVAAGDLDAIDVAPAQQAEVWSADLPDDVSRRRSAGTEWTQLTMNGSAGPLRDTAVRRAVAQALDRTALAGTSSKPVGAAPTVVDSFVYLPGQVGYPDDADGRLRSDVAAAREALAKAGWTLESGASVRTRDGAKLTLTMPVPADTPSIQDRATLIADQLADVGIEVSLEDVPAEDFFTERIVPLDFDLATFTHAGSAFPVTDAEKLFHPIDSAQNFTGREDDELAAEWDDAIAALDAADRYADVARIDERLFDDAPMVPLGVTARAAVVSRAVVNYGPAQFVAPDWTVVGFGSPDGD